MACPHTAPGVGSGDPRDLEPFVCAGLSAVNLEDYGAGKSAQRPVETAPQVLQATAAFYGSYMSNAGQQQYHHLLASPEEVSGAPPRQIYGQGDGGTRASSSTSTKTPAGTTRLGARAAVAEGDVGRQTRAHSSTSNKAPARTTRLGA